MWKAVLRRAMLAVLTVVGGGLLSATLSRYAPGFGTDERQLDARLSSASLAAIRAQHAAERNIFTYYAGSLQRAFRGDLGTSSTLNRPVRELLAQRFPVTLQVVVRGLAIGWLLALLLVLAEWLVRTPLLVQCVTLSESALLCLPAAVMALLAVLLNAPAYLALALIIFPKVHRYLSNLVSDIREQAYLITARATGASELRLLLRHVCPALRREALALAGVSAGLAISAAIPLEALCGIPGIGQLAWQSAMARDLPLLVNLSVLIIAGVTLANTGADLLADQGRIHA